MVDNDDALDPLAKRTFTYDNCFVCGSSIVGDNLAQEHVYPKWLQNMFNLWNQELILLNGSAIKYKSLTIPCCKSCNNRMSAKFEKPIQRAVEAGYSEFVKLNRDIVFLCLNKISYGLLFKELSLKYDLKDPNSNTIYCDEYLREHEMQYLFLKSSILDTKFINSPYSMLIFKIDPCNEEPYWAFDNLITQTHFIRMKDIGIMCHLMDNGFNEEFFLSFDEHKALLNKILHPIQFAELCARFFYKSSLFSRDPFYTIVYDKNVDPQIIINHQISGHAFNDWDNEKYAYCLATLLRHRGIEYENLYVKDKGVRTFIWDNNGNFENIVDSLKRKDGGYYDAKFEFE